MSRSQRRLESASRNSLISGKSDEERANDPWEIVRAALYKTLRIRGRRSSKTKTRMSLYIESLSRSASQGDMNAIRDHRILMSRLDNDKRKPASKLSESSRKFHETHVIPHQQKVARLTVDASLAYAQIIHQLRSDYELKHGRPPEEPFSKPKYIDDQIVAQALRTATRNNEAGRTEAGVGYGKTPLKTRWKPGQSGNASGKSNVFRSGFDEFWANLLVRHPVIVDGRKTKLSNAAIICSRLIEAAIKGDPRARREVRNFLIELDKRNLLSPPPQNVDYKKSYVRFLSKNTDFRYAITRKVSFEVKRSMQADFLKVYGPDDDFLKNIGLEEQAFYAIVNAKKAA